MSEDLDAKTINSLFVADPAIVASVRDAAVAALATDYYDLKSIIADEANRFVIEDRTAFVDSLLSCND